MTDHNEFLRDTDSDLAVLMIHGIVGSPAHFKNLIDVIPEDITLRNILLDGHGKGVSDFGRSSMKKWKAQVSAEVEALFKAHSKVFIVAHSMGTLFAIGEAIKNPDKICGLFLLSVPSRPHVRFSTVITSLKAMWGGKGEDVERMLADTSIKLSPYLWKYISWIPRYIELLAEISRIRKLLPNLKVRTKTFQSRTDELVSFRSVKDLENHPYIHNTVLYNSGHFAYGHDDTELLRAELKKCINEIKLGQ